MVALQEPRQCLLARRLAISLDTQRLGFGDIPPYRPPGNATHLPAGSLALASLPAPDHLSNLDHCYLQKGHADLLSRSAVSSSGRRSGGGHHSGDPGITAAMPPGITLAISPRSCTLSLAIHRRPMI